jgi:hypothetical protein
MGQRDPRCAAPGCTFVAVTGQPTCVQHGGQPAARLTTAPIDHMRFCNATRRDGGNCTQPAMKGQQRCRMHGGSAPMAQAKAVERIAETRALDLANKHGLPRSISAVDALQEELDRTQGRIDWLEDQLALQPHDGALLAVYSAERGHLRQLAGGMVTGKVDQRRNVLAEQYLDFLEAAVTATLSDFGLDPHSDLVRRRIGRHLEELSSSGGSPQRNDVIDAEIVSKEPIPQPVTF